MIPIDLTLEAGRAQLRPLKAEDFDAFLPLASDPDAWTYFSLNLSDPVQLRQWMDLALREQEAGTRRPFTVIDRQEGSVAGSMSFGNISLHDKRIEIGWSWLGARYRSTGLNRQCKFALMRYAFDVLAFERVEFKTDVRNLRARQGLRKVGGVEEGILRSHMLLWNNHRRDSVYYSVIRPEWAGLREGIFKDLAT